jgi:hypothetical protein
VLARTEWHLTHRLFWAAVLARQGRLREASLSADPIVTVWRRALRLIGSPGDAPAEAASLLRDWRACPQILVGR